MQSSYFPEFPKDDYALAVLTRAAAMHESSDKNTNTSRRSIGGPTAGYPAEHFSTPGNNSTGFQTGTSFLVNAQQVSDRSANLRPEQSGSDILRDGGHSSAEQHGVTSNISSNNMQSSRTIGALSFNPLLGQPGRHYVQGGYDGMSGQVSHELGILSAETYNDGRGNLTSNEISVIRRQMQNNISSEISGGQALGEGGNEELDSNRRSRKKQRTDSDDDEARKKARGRPRVDTRDETAADRRRTQIRMAQRAYRHRKETTIASLEKKVQDLRSANEEMNNIFLTLHDHAVSKCLLQREPEFGQQLVSATERFLDLAKASQNENHEEDLIEATANHPEFEVSPRTKGRQKSPKKRKGVNFIVDPEPEPEHEPEHEPELEPPVSAWGGYTVSKDDSPVEEIGLAYEQQNHTYRNDLQIITRPTEDNASFPFGLMDLQSYRVDVPQVEDFSQFLLPQSQLPLPRTHDYHEFSFARRLFRRGSEKGLQLIRSTDPNRAARLREVFGLCLMYESRAEIEARLRKIIGRSAKEPLPDWRQPFLHVGGAGTYYPRDDNDIDQEDMLKFRTDYSMGPFPPLASHAQEFMNGMHCTLPGYEGAFFDHNDVEGYLRGRGLVIPPLAEFVTAELDISTLDNTSPRSETSGSVDSLILPMTPRPADNLLLDLENDSNLRFEIPKSDSSITKPLGLPFPLGFTNWDSEVGMDENTKFSQFNITPDQQPRSTKSNFSTTRIHSNKRTVTISIPVLIEELTSRCVCLGRAPGYRPADINAAIIATIRTAFGEYS